MIRRTRSIVGLITAFVLVLSLAEGVWAAACIPAMEVGAASTASAHEHRDRPGGVPGHEHEPARRGVPDCPLGPAGGVQGCSVAASLPASFAAGIAASPEAALEGSSVAAEPDILLGSALFHPPRP